MFLKSFFFSPNPVSPHPLNLGGADLPPKFGGGVSKTPCLMQYFSRTPPLNLGDESSPLKFRGHAPTGKGKSHPGGALRFQRAVDVLSSTMCRNSNRHTTATQTAATCMPRFRNFNHRTRTLAVEIPFRKILAPIKIESALPPPPLPKAKYPPKTRNFMDMGFPAERTQFSTCP